MRSSRATSSSAGATGCTRSASSGRTSSPSPRRRSSPRRPSRASPPGIGSTTSCSARSRSTSTATTIGFEDAMAKLYSPDRDLRRRAAEAVTAALEPGLRTRDVRLQHDRRRQVDRRPPARIRDVDLLAQPLERHDRRGGAGADRRRRRPLRRRAALLPLEGPAARARHALLLRPHGAARRRPDARRLGRGVRHRRSARSPTSRPRRGTSSSASSATAGSTRPRGTASGPARSARRTSPACTRTSS